MARLSCFGACIFNWTAIAFVYNLFYHRAELEHTYSKGLQKLAGKLLRASKEMSRKYGLCVGPPRSVGGEKMKKTKLWARQIGRDQKRLACSSDPGVHPHSAPPTAPGVMCQTRCTRERTPTGRFSNTHQPAPSIQGVPGERHVGASFNFRSLGTAFQQEAILEIRQVMDEHNKRKRPVCNRFGSLSSSVITSLSRHASDTLLL